MNKWRSTEGGPKIKKRYEVKKVSAKHVFEYTSAGLLTPAPAAFITDSQIRWAYLLKNTDTELVAYSCLQLEARVGLDFPSTHCFDGGREEEGLEQTSSSSSALCRGMDLWTYGPMDLPYLFRLAFQ